MLKLEINDLDKLKITRVKYYLIYFDYDGEHYMLINDTDEDAHLSLYRRNITDKGFVTLEFITGRITTLSIGSFIRYAGKQMVYANINKEYFVKTLVKAEMSTGLYEYSYNKMREQVDKISDEIAKLKDKRETLINAYNNSPSGKYTDAMARKVIKANEGKLCKEYGAPYGSSHPQYGGTLVDLRMLPIGTCFEVTNGDYDATIVQLGQHSKGICTLKSCVEFTEDKHSAYIETNLLNMEEDEV